MHEWVELTGRENWPVPRPTARGDWLAVNSADFNRLQNEIVRGAFHHVLPGTAVPTDLFNSRVPSDARGPLWPISVVTATKPHVLIIWRDAWGDTREDKQQTILALEKLTLEQPDVQFVGFMPRKNGIAYVLPAVFINAVRQSLTADHQRSPEAKPSPDDTPATNAERLPDSGKATIRDVTAATPLKEVREEDVWRPADTPSAENALEEKRDAEAEDAADVEPAEDTAQSKEPEIGVEGLAEDENDGPSFY